MWDQAQHYDRIIQRIEALYRRRRLLAVHLMLYGLLVAPLIASFLFGRFFFGMSLTNILFLLALIDLPVIAGHTVSHVMYELRERAIQRALDRERHVALYSHEYELKRKRLEPVDLDRLLDDGELMVEDDYEEEYEAGKFKRGS